MEKWNKEDATITEEVLNKLPSIPIGFLKNSMSVATVMETDMEGKEVPAVICVWADRGKFMPGVRKGYFSLSSGEYLGDAFVP